MHKIKISKWSGRLGNNLFQLSKAIHLAKCVGGIVYLPDPSTCETVQLELFTDFNEIILPGFPPTVTEGVKPNGPFVYRKEYHINNLHLKHNIFESTFTSECDAFTKLLKITEFNNSYYGPQLRRIFKDNIRDIVDMCLLDVKGDHMNSFKPADDVLTVHIRGGDIMNSKTAHPGFPQAPFSFLEKILKTGVYSKLTVCTEYDGELSPVFENLKLYCERHLISIDASNRSLKNDIELILDSHNLVIMGHTSFSRSLALCSRRLKSLYIPRIHQLKKSDICQQALADSSEIALYAYRFTDYFNDGEEWSASEEQKQKMLSHPVSKVWLEI